MRVLVSGTEFCRNVLRVVRGARDIRTVTFPKTVRWAENGAFRSKTLKSAVLNEGLEVLGYYKGHYLSDIFTQTQLQSVALPSTLMVLGNNIF